MEKYAIRGEPQPRACLHCGGGGISANIRSGTRWKTRGASDSCGKTMQPLRDFAELTLELE